MSALAPVIPEDIDRIATDIVRTNFGVDGDPEWEMYITIARAILAERERCAQIAEAVDSKRGNEEFIAHFIRNPHLPSGAAACAADTAGAEIPPSVLADQFESDAEAEIARLESVIEKSGGIGNALSDMLGVDVEIVRADAGADITMKHTNIAGVA